MIKHPAKDPVSIVLGILVTGILIFLAYQAVMLSGSLSKYRVVIEKLISRSDKETRENRDANKANREEIRKNQIVNKENQEEISKTQAVGKDNSATLEQNEKRLSKIEREIGELRSKNPDQP